MKIYTVGLDTDSSYDCYVSLDNARARFPKSEGWELVHALDETANQKEVYRSHNPLVGMMHGYIGSFETVD